MPVRKKRARRAGRVGIFMRCPCSGEACFYRVAHHSSTMNPPLRLLPALILAFCAVHGVMANDDSFEAPDSLVLKNGKTVRGLIIKNSRDAVLLQEKSAETSYPKSEIVRIRDEANTKAMFTGVNRKGD